MSYCNENPVSFKRHIIPQQKPFPFQRHAVQQRKHFCIPKDISCNILQQKHFPLRAHIVLLRKSLLLSPDESYCDEAIILSHSQIRLHRKLGEVPFQKQPYL